MVTMAFELFLLMFIGMWPLMLVFGAGIVRRTMGARRPASAG